MRIPKKNINRKITKIIVGYIVYLSDSRRDLSKNLSKVHALSLSPPISLLLGKDCSRALVMVFFTYGEHRDTYCLVLIPSS
jgi:hypothetical protein